MTEPRASVLYVGSVMHRRLAPRRHRLRYRAFWLLIDLDETFGELRLFSRNRFNLVSFHDGDHGDGRTRPLRAYVERTLAEHAIDWDGGRIALLCMPRILGYVFNPLSIYFCHRRDGSLAALLYEVRNTFGQMHSYLLPVAADAPLVHQRCDKVFYVSPFLGMDLTYDFRVAPPADKVSVVVSAASPRGPVLTASLVGERRALSDRALALALVTHPLLTLKVVGAIHWEALKIWWKGIRLHPRPPAPAHPVTAMPPDRPQDKR
ncbi:MAG: DUF1365 domain-containing protein [Pseudolabrys sp.]